MVEELRGSVGEAVVNQGGALRRVASKVVGSLATSVLVVFACAAPQKDVRARAASDLACPADALEVNHLGGGVYEARGCEKRARYLADCPNAQ